MSNRPALALLLSLVLTACGGGGGSGGGSTGSTGSTASGDLRIGAVSPASIQRTLSDSDVGSPPFASVVLDAPFTGSASGTIYLVVEDPDLVLETPSIAQFTDRVSLEFPVRRSLPAGRYTAPIVLHACKDTACREEFPGSPQTIPKDITVTGLALSASSLAFTSTAALAPAAQSVTVTPPPGQDFTADFRVTYTEYTDPQGNRTLLTPSEVFQITASPGKIEVQPLPAWAGHYVLQFPVSSPNHGSRTLTVDYQVGSGVTPLITLLTPSVSVAGPVGNDLLATVDVRRTLPNLNTAIARLGTPDPVQTDWFSVSGIDTAFTLPTLPADVIRYTLKMNACGRGFGTCLSAGTYTGTFRVSGSAFGVDTTVDVPVSFTAGAPFSPPPPP